MRKKRVIKNNNNNNIDIKKKVDRLKKIDISV